MRPDPWGLESEECKGACVLYCLGGNKGKRHKGGERERERLISRNAPFCIILI